MLCRPKWISNTSSYCNITKIQQKRRAAAVFNIMAVVAPAYILYQRIIVLHFKILSALFQQWKFLKIQCKNTNVTCSSILQFKLYLKLLKNIHWPKSLRRFVVHRLNISLVKYSANVLHSCPFSTYPHPLDGMKKKAWKYTYFTGFLPSSSDFAPYLATPTVDWSEGKSGRGTPSIRTDDWRRTPVPKTHISYVLSSKAEPLKSELCERNVLLGHEENLGFGPDLPAQRVFIR